MTTGLTLGKFAPFHTGHQLVIETGLAEVDQLVVVVYRAPAQTRVSLRVRASWIRSIYPQVEVIEAPDGPEESGMAPGIIRAQNDYLRRLLGGRVIDVFFSSEPYGDSVARAFGAENRLVDSRRDSRPVSGTALRAAFAALPASAAEKAATFDIPFAGELHPVVRADLLPRVVLLGGPSTGKTTTAAAIARRIGEPLCPEYGRDYWFKHQKDHRLSMTDLETIAAEQVRRERETAAGARRLVVSDTSPLTTLAYAKYYFGFASPVLEETASMYHEYDRMLVLCDTDIPFDDSADRSGPGSRDRLQQINRDEFSTRNLSYITVSGSVENRVKSIIEALGAWRYQC